MKTAFALALLSVGVDSAISAVTGDWGTKNHITDTSLTICATHGTAVTTAASGTITYKYSDATCTQASAAASVVAELKWGTGTTKALATSNGAVKATCLIDDTAKTVTCSGVAVTATQFSCVQLLKCRPMARTIATTGIQVKQSETDSSYVNAGAATDFAAAALAALTVTKPTAAEAKVGADEFVMEFAIDPTADIASGSSVTVLAPGYKQNIGGACQFGALTASAVTTAVATDAWTFTSASASGATATTLKCTKVQAAAEKAAGKFAVISGASATAAAEAKWVDSLAVVTTTAAPTTTTTAAPSTSSAATASLSAAALLLAASLYM